APMPAERIDLMQVKADLQKDADGVKKRLIGRRIAVSGQWQIHALRGKYGVPLNTTAYLQEPPVSVQIRMPPMEESPLQLRQVDLEGNVRDVRPNDTGWVIECDEGAFHKKDSAAKR